MTRSITAIVVSDMLARCPGVGAEGGGCLEMGGMGEEERIKIQSVYAPVQRGWGGWGRGEVPSQEY